MEVVIATDGADGVEKAKSEKPNLILMDLSLPIMDGWTATKIIKSDDNIKHIPVIALFRTCDGRTSILLPSQQDVMITILNRTDFKRLLSKIEPYLKRTEQ